MLLTDVSRLGFGNLERESEWVFFSKLLLVHCAWDDAEFFDDLEEQLSPARRLRGQDDVGLRTFHGHYYMTWAKRLSTRPRRRADVSGFGGSDQNKIDVVRKGVHIAPRSQLRHSHCSPVENVETAVAEKKIIDFVAAAEIVQEDRAEGFLPSRNDFRLSLECIDRRRDFG